MGDPRLLRTAPLLTLRRVRSTLLIFGALAFGCALDHHGRGGTGELMPDEVAPDEAAVPRPRRDAAAALADEPDPLEPDVHEPDAATPQPRTDAEAVRGPEQCNGGDDDGDGRRDEGCPFRLTDAVFDAAGGWETPVQLDDGRVIWLQLGDEGHELWSAKLPHGAPTRLRTGDYPLRAVHDGDRIAYVDYERFGYVIRDLQSGAERFIKPIDPSGSNLLQMSLEGRYFAYTQDVGGCGGCENSAIFLHDLELDSTQVIDPDPNISMRPRLGAGQLIWLDDRFAHHTDEYGLDHRYDLFAVALPYVPGSARRLTMSPPRSTRVLAFAGARVLIDTVHTYESPPPEELRFFRLLDVVRDQPIALDALLPQGDVPLALSSTHVLVRRDPLVRCHLEVVSFETRRSFEIDTEGQCPTHALIDGDFVVWTRTLGASTRLYWLEIGGLDDVAR